MKNFLKTCIFMLLLIFMLIGLVGCGKTLTEEATAIADEVNAGIEEIIQENEPREESTKENLNEQELKEEPKEAEQKEEPKKEQKEEPKEAEPEEEAKEVLNEDPIDEELQGEKEPTKTDENVKVAYLTFDDGPSPVITPKILDILKEYNIKATFFVIGNLAEEYPDILLRTQEEGHLIANHTYTHNYKHIYSHPQNLINELKKTDEVLLSILGEGYGKPKFMRFPGGSFGDKLKPFRQAVKEAGYISVDWNVLNGDAEAPYVSPEQQLKRLKETLQNKKQAIVLMHNSIGKQTTVDALPDIIEYMISQGYIFKTLEPDILLN